MGQAQEWVEDVSAYLKSVDPNHLVLLGHSGIFGASTPDLCVRSLIICCRSATRNRNYQVHA